MVTKPTLSDRAALLPYLRVLHNFEVWFTVEGLLTSYSWGYQEPEARYMFAGILSSVHLSTILSVLVFNVHYYISP